MLRYLTHQLPLIVLLGLLTNGLPSASLVTLPKASAQSNLSQIEEPISQPLTIPPVVDPHLPSLILHLALAPNPVAIGDTVTLTLTVTNEALDPAEDLVVTLPTPDGALALPGPHTLSPTAGWRWPVGHLDGRSSADVTGQLRLLRRPSGDALLLHAQATARGLDLPIHEIGGALLTNRTLSTATIRFLPGATARLRSRDRRVQVDLPSRAFGRALNLRHAPTPLAETIPPAVAGFRRGFGIFFLNATDDAGQAVHQFTAPLTLTLSYTPEQLQALGIAESDLTLTWYNAATQAWQTIPTSVDPATQTTTALVDHFSAFQLSDGASPSAAFIPSLQGFQVSSFTGAASYRYPIDVPAGAGGLKPNLSLSYSSAATDGTSGQRPKQQAGWVGQGWSLDTGSIARNKIRISASSTVEYYTVVVNGQSYDLQRGVALVGQPSAARPQDWQWLPTDEHFARVQVFVSGTADPATRGGVDPNGVAYPRTTWRIWTTDGTRYDFVEDLWWGFCTAGAQPYLETYKWLLSSVTDPNQNTITYTYDRAKATILQDTSNCSHVKGTVDHAAWPTTISWGSNSATGAPARYRVTFVPAMRTNDTQFEGAENQYPNWSHAPHESRRLDVIKVESKPASSWQLVRQYNLRYGYSLTPDQPLCPSSCTANTDYLKLTLNDIQQIGAYDNNPNGTPPLTLPGLPLTTFGYGAFGVTGDHYPVGGWNRLTSVNNGQGGTVTLAYANIGHVLNNPLFANYRRVTTRTMTDGRGNTYPWSYSYGTPNLNSIGTTLGGKGTRAQPNAATLYLNKKWSTSDNTVWLVHKAYTEFRGHDYVIEVDPNGGQTKHFFYQGDAGCVPTASGGTLATYDSDPCFVEIRRREVLKGREYRTQRYGAGVVIDPAPPTPPPNPLQETLHTFAVPFFGYSGVPLSGLWRAFTFESQTDQKQYEGGGTPIGGSTRYCYDIQQQGGVQYGNLTHTRVYGQLITTDQNVVADCDLVGLAPTPLRVTRQAYALVNTATQYMVDRVAQEAVFDGQLHLIALTEHFYDGSTTSGSLGSAGLRTQSCAYRDVTQGTMQATVTRAGYDAWGNPTTTTTYSAWGQRNVSGSTVSCAAPAANTARTTTTSYDNVFHAFPAQVSNQLSQIQRADYDYRLGTLVRVTGPNTTGTTTNCSQTSYATPTTPSTNTYTIPPTEESSCAQYDVFGRMVKLVKPGDSTALPTLLAFYGDTEQPFHYRIDRREDTNTANVRVEQQFYDGLGRQIQTKAESANNSQNIVVDTRYDGLGQVMAQSQPRYVAETATTFVQYTVPPAPPTLLFNPTITTYDALGRVRVLTAPGSITTNTSYALGSLGPIAATVDPNGHKTERESDVFGRLRTVREYSGAGSYTLYATTTYAYSPLDQLTTVTDTASNVTSLSYDSLGRKLTTNDRDMGLWRYSYNANGNLLTQTDAKGQTITFGYDALDRLTSKTLPGGWTSAYAYDQTNPSNVDIKGKGRRTSMATALNGTPQTYARWEYDARGRTTLVGQSVTGLVMNMTFAYDSADRLTQQTSHGETLTYTYDAAWRPTSVCGTLCYVSGAIYTALNQPDHWTLGNTLLQDWVYSSPMQRLQRLTVGSGTPASIFDRAYTYDNGSNVTAITDNKSAANNQSYTYDHRNRLTTWTLGSTTQTYTYNVLGNITSKPGNGVYTYPASGPTSVRPHTPSAVNGAAYGYDANGNLLTGGGRIYTWTAENQPASVSHVSGIESSTYDADGERVVKTVGSTTTAYFQGVFEQTGSTWKHAYVFNGQVVAVRDQTGAVSYLHGDHLGSISVATTSAGVAAGTQEYDPWGARRSGNIPQTTLNYTGQRLDGTGLLYYHARLYDPLLGRFVSADSVVPGSASGGMDGVALKPLTVDFHEPGFVARVNSENKQPFWFQMSDEQRQKAGSPWGPANPQSLNRYSYVQNNPLRYTDPTGHCSSGIWGVFDLSCLREAVAIWENTSPGTPEHALGAAYIGLSAVALVYGSVGAGKLIQAVAEGGSLSNQITRLFLKSKDVDQALAKYNNQDLEQLLKLKEVYTRNIDFLAWQINKLGLGNINVGHISDFINATASLQAIEILIKQLQTK